MHMCHMIKGEQEYSSIRVQRDVFKLWKGRICLQANTFLLHKVSLTAPRTYITHIVYYFTLCEVLTISWAYVSHWSRIILTIITFLGGIFLICFHRLCDHKGIKLLCEYLRESLYFLSIISFTSIVQPLPLWFDNCLSDDHFIPIYIHPSSRWFWFIVVSLINPLFIIHLHIYIKVWKVRWYHN